MNREVSTDGRSRISIAEAVANELREGESIVSECGADLGRGGCFQDIGLFATSERLIVAERQLDQRIDVSSTPLADIKKAAVRTDNGCATLAAEVADRRKDLARATNAHIPGLEKIADLLNHGIPSPDDSLEPPGNESEESPAGSDAADNPEPARKGSPGLTAVVRRILRYLLPHWKTALGMTVLVSASALVGVVPPYLTKVLIDDVLTTGKAAGLLLPIILTMVGIHVFGMTLGILQARMTATLSSTMTHDIRMDLYRAIHQLTFPRYDRVEVGTLLSRLMTDTGRLNTTIIGFGSRLVPTVLQTAGTMAVLFWMNWVLAATMLVPVPIFAVAYFAYQRAIHHRYHRTWLRQDRMSALANNALSGFRIVKAFAQEWREILRFGNRSEAVRQSAKEQETLSGTYTPLLGFLLTSGSFAVWYVGGKMVLGEFGGASSVSLGTLVAFIAYMGMLYGPIQWIMGYGSSLNQAITAAQRLFELIDAEHENVDDPAAVKGFRVNGEIEFRDVHFGYEKGREVLKGVSFTVEAGEMIGLVGRSGVGKTTTTNLICRFYDVDRGQILIDGEDSRNLSLRELREQIGIVPQDPFVFDGTIAENISYAKPTARPEEVIMASIAANTLEFILRRSEAFDTKTGGPAGRFSGGEKQRISIARAILHNPRILILDEATSSVDTETEREVQNALQRLVVGRTTIAIAHRLSTLKFANRLVVLEDGEVAEIGRHDELVERDGTYARLVRMQSELSAIAGVTR